MDIIRQIELYYANMTKSERHAADEILKNMEPLANDPAKKAAELYNTSTTTLVRLSKRLGFSGYSEFSFQMKTYLKNNTKVQKKEPYQPLRIGELIGSFKEAFDSMVTPEIDSQLGQFVEKLRQANRIIAIGIGHSGLAAEHLKYLMLSKGIMVDTVTDSVLVNRLPTLIKKDDLVVIFSSSADQGLYGGIFNRASKSDVTLILITMNPNSKALKQADIGILVPTVHGTDWKTNSIKYIDSRPVFYVLISCLTRIYDDKFPNNK